MSVACWCFRSCEKAPACRRGFSGPHHAPLQAPGARFAQDRVFKRLCSAALKIQATSSSRRLSGKAFTRCSTLAASCNSRAGSVRSTGNRMTRVRLLMSRIEQLPCQTRLSREFFWRLWLMRALRHGGCTQFRLSSSRGFDGVKAGGRGSAGTPSSFSASRSSAVVSPQIGLCSVSP